MIFFLLCVPHTDHDESRLWCICFYPLENALISTADDGCSYDSNRTKPFAALTAIFEENREDFQPVTPRLLKTVFLHQCMQYPHDEDWQEKRLGRAFVDLFLAVIKSLKRGRCEHFFLTEQNLLGNEDKYSLKPVVHHLKAILNDIVQNPDRSAFLPVPARVRKLRRTESKS